MKFETSPDKNTAEAVQQEKREFSRGDLEISLILRGPDAPEQERIRELGIPAKIAEISVASKTADKKIRLNDLITDGWLMAETKPNPSLFSYAGTMATAEARPQTKWITYPKTVMIPRLNFLAKDYDLRARTEQSETKASGFFEMIKYESHDFLKMKGAFLTLLHEIGHSKEPEQNAKEAREDAYMRFFASTIDRKREKGILKSDPGIIDKYIDIVIQNERSAWAFALHTYRTFLQQGIDVEPDMTLKEIFESIGDALRSYYPTNKPEKLEHMRREKLTGKTTKD